MKTESEEVSVLLFYVNQVLCMLPVEFITSIEIVEIHQKNVTSVPNMPDYICGNCSLKGKDIILVDLEKLLKFNVQREKTILAKQEAIVLEGGIALVPDQIVGVDWLEHLEKSSPNIFCGKMVDSLYTLGTAIRSYYHIQDKDSIVFGLNMSEIFNDIKHNQIYDNKILQS